MIPALTTSKIFSTLGSNNSLVPLAIKDVANSLGLTAGSYITGDKVEGKDRFIDEFGTQAIWLFGIPVYKKVLDLTLFKSLGFDPKVDVRLLQNHQIFEKAKHFAEGKILKSLEKTGQNPQFFKKLSFAKFALSTALTIISYGALTKFRHTHTEKEITKNFYEKQTVDKKKFAMTGSVPFSSAFGQIHKPVKPAFTGGLQDFMINPVKNLMIVDASISTERLADARNTQDRIGYVIKEGGFWTFMYLAVKPIQKWLEKAAEKKHGKSIDLDARVIESEDLKLAFKNNSISNCLSQFPIKGTDAEIYEFINTHPNNFIVKMAKKSDIIPTLKEKGVMKMHRKIDNRGFIDIADVKDTAHKLEKLYNQYMNSGDGLDLFLKKVKNLKRGSVFKNMGICVGVLGVLVPAIMVAIRFADKDNKNFKVQEDIEKKLSQNAQ